tara:strand:+ start:424 stop:624 length:201 start_codon:yes stop_codon:yes gene_type:complete
MNNKLKGPLVDAIEANTDGVIMQEFITYRVRDGMLVKEMTKRQFSENGKDYQDSKSTIPLIRQEYV